MRVKVIIDWEEFTELLYCERVKLFFLKNDTSSCVVPLKVLKQLCLIKESQ